MKKARRDKCKKQDAFLHVEGTQYESGHFYEADKAKAKKAKKNAAKSKK